MIDSATNEGNPEKGSCFMCNGKGTLERTYDGKEIPCAFCNDPAEIPEEFHNSDDDYIPGNKNYLKYDDPLGHDHSMDY